MINNGKEREFWGRNRFEIQRTSYSILYSYSDLKVPPNAPLKRNWLVGQLQAIKVVLKCSLTPFADVFSGHQFDLKGGTKRRLLKNVWVERTFFMISFTAVNFYQCILVSYRRHMTQINLFKQKYNNLGNITLFSLSWLNNRAVQPNRSNYSIQSQQK